MPDEILAGTVKRKLPKTGQYPVVADIIVRTPPIQARGERIGLLKTDLIGNGVDGVAPGVGAGQFKSAAELVFQLKDSGVIAGIDIVQRDKNPAETIVPGRVWC